MYQSLNCCTTKTKKLIYKQLNIVENKIVDAAFSQKKIYQICFFITKKENNWQPSITIKQNKKTVYKTITMHECTLCITNIAKSIYFVCLNYPSYWMRLENIKNLPNIYLLTYYILDTGHFFHRSLTQCLVFLGIL